MKILFITYNDLQANNYGGAQCSNRNRDLLKEFGQVTTYVIKKKSNMKSVLSSLNLFFPPLLMQDYKSIDQILAIEKFDFIFCDISLLGSLIKKIKRKYSIPTISFFHNIEIDYIDVRFGKRLIKYPYKILAWINEKRTSIYSDKIITLSERDSKRLNDKYNRIADEIIPITFNDRTSLEEMKKYYEEKNHNNKKICLFVGALSHPNYEGIRWFVENVAEDLPATIKIVGRNFENKRDELERKNVEVIGSVDNLLNYYIEADCVISPLLRGAGMKVKIAEALMYGKTIFGSTESFAGYEIDISKVGGICEKKEDYLEKIDSLKMNSPLNEESRRVFEDKYSNERAIKILSRILG